MVVDTARKLMCELMVISTSLVAIVLIIMSTLRPGDPNQWIQIS